MTPTSASSQEIALTRLTFVRLGRAIRNFARSEVGGRAAALVGVLVTLLFAINGLNVVNSYVGRYFMTAVEQRDVPEFARQAMFYVAVFAVTTLVAVLQRFTEERLGLLRREWLTLRLVGNYLRERMYYQVEVGGSLPNPDQRIARFAVLAPAALGTEQAAHVLATLAQHGIGYVVLGDGGLDRDSFDAIVEIAADGTWTHTVTTEVRQ